MPHLVRSSQGSVTTHNSPHFENVCTTVRTYSPNSTLRISFTPDNCKVCDPCLLYKIDCGECVNCLDKPKFGGPGRRKKKCIMKGCLVVEKYRKERANQKINRRKNQTVNEGALNWAKCRTRYTCQRTRRLQNNVAKLCMFTSELKIFVSLPVNVLKW